MFFFWGDAEGRGFVGGKFSFYHLAFSVFMVQAVWCRDVTCQHPAKLDLKSYLCNPFRTNDFGPAQTSDPVSHGDSIAL